jgi:hypothetical protein
MVDRKRVCSLLRPQSGPAQLLRRGPTPQLDVIVSRGVRSERRPDRYFVVPYSETATSVWPDSGGIRQTSGTQRQAQGVDPGLCRAP